MKTPERTCVVCRARAKKAELARLVVVAEKLVFDQMSKLPGRGAYIHQTWGCWSKFGWDCRKGSLIARLERALKIKTTELDKDSVRETGELLRQLLASEDGSDGRISESSSLQRSRFQGRGRVKL